MSTITVDQKRLLINNEWRPSSGGQTMEVINPATEEVVAEVASADTADVDAAVKAARAALNVGAWFASSPIA
jgi:aldehyde dehydrogenase (NAD+)